VLSEKCSLILSLFEKKVEWRKKEEWEGSKGRGGRWRDFLVRFDPSNYKLMCNAGLK
jgi:hypothetical protein